jgi:rhodanese-related sulfurtransferase
VHNFMKTITVEELKAKIDAGEHVNLVDVREPHEHAEFNIGGLLLPLGNVQTMQIDAIEDLRDQTVYVYCRSGNRSGQACLMLDTFGFKDTYNVVGGMLAWKEKFQG